MTLIKQISFFRRRTDVSAAAFHEHWRTTHAEIVKPLPGLVRYTQNHALATVTRDGEPPFDGTAEVWFESMDAMRANVGSERLAMIRADEANFIDPHSMGTLITEEIAVIDGTPGANAKKLVGLINRRRDLSVEDFQATWRDQLGPIVQGVPGLERYVQAHCRLGIYRTDRTPPYDGAAGLWFAGEQGVAEAMASDAMRAANALEATFIDFERSAIAWVEEVHIIE